jgi:hypothetical protein
MWLKQDSSTFQVPMITAEAVVLAVTLSHADASVRRDSLV